MRTGESLTASERVQRLQTALLGPHYHAEMTKSCGEAVRYFP